MKLKLHLSALVLGFCCLSFAQMRHWERTYDLQDVNWTLSYDETSKTISGETVNTVTQLKDGLTEVSFDLKGLEVTRVAVDGVDSTYARKGDQLIIKLPAPSKAGAVNKVSIKYSGSPQAGVYFVPAKRASPAKTSMVYTQGEMIDNRLWIPTYDWPDDKATFECHIAVPRGQKAISNGKLLDVSSNGDKDIFHWKLDQPSSTYLISFVCGDYFESKPVMALNGTVPVNYYVPSGLQDMGEVSFGMTPKIVDLYSKITHFNYPYAKFTQDAVGDYMFGGMENITCVTQTITTLHPKADDPYRRSDGLVAHELAHQWFGDTITCLDWKHVWLNEGFATFMPHFWTREAQGVDQYDIDRVDTLNGARGAAGRTDRGIVFDGYSGMMDLFDGNTYGGGAARLFLLMNTIGEEAFWNGVGQYLNKYKFSNATTENFFEVMSQASGQDLTPFMRQWFYRIGLPDIKLTKQIGHLKAKLDKPDYNFKLPVWILANGRWVKRTMDIKNSVGDLDLEDNDGPVLVDPDAYNLCHVNYDALRYAEEDWVNMFRKAPTGSKYRILSDQFGAVIEPTWIRLLTSERTNPIRARLIARLNSLPTGWLVEHFQSEPPEVSIECLRKLQGRTDEGAPTLMGSIYHDEDGAVTLRMIAMESLLGQGNATALAEEALNTRSYEDRIRRRALRYIVDHDKEDGRNRCLLIIRNPTSENLRVDAIGMLGQLKDVPGEKTVLHALMLVAAEDSFGAKRAAMQALGAYGDPEAISVIQPLTNHPLHFLANAAKDVMRQLKH